MTADKRILIIAGPNGAGKTTFAMEFLPKEADCPIFVNADRIAAAWNPFGPARSTIKAGRVMLDEIHQHAKNGETFAFETTLAGRRYARLIPAWQKHGYEVSLFFLRLPASDLAVSRVRQRVLEGGHDVPEQVVRRRFHAGWRNFESLYRPLVDVWVLYDNSGNVPVLLGEGKRT